jgi:hypothetical protein
MRSAPKHRPLQEAIAILNCRATGARLARTAARHLRHPASRHRSRPLQGVVLERAILGHRIHRRSQLLEKRLEEVRHRDSRALLYLTRPPLMALGFLRASESRRGVPGGFEQTEHERSSERCPGMQSASTIMISDLPIKNLRDLEVKKTLKSRDGPTRSKPETAATPRPAPTQPAPADKPRRTGSSSRWGPQHQILSQQEVTIAAGPRASCRQAASASLDTCGRTSGSSRSSKSLPGGLKGERGWAREVSSTRVAGPSLTRTPLTPARRRSTSTSAQVPVQHPPHGRRPGHLRRAKARPRTAALAERFGSPVYAASIPAKRIGRTTGPAHGRF